MHKVKTKTQKDEITLLKRRLKKCASRMKAGYVPKNPRDDPQAQAARIVEILFQEI